MIRKLTILHSNDMHGAFLPEERNGEETGGLPMLAGYIRKVRAEESDVIYAIAGDMFKGSVIDSEYRGLSTIELMNLMEPDVAAIGNHEVDYGVGHLLFAERCASFPLISANLHISTNRARLLPAYHVIERTGIKIMFIGLVTPELVNQTTGDKLISKYVEIRDALKEVGTICETYRPQDIDYTILLTHLGFEQDQELAAALKPEWGINMIIGGHSHTFLEEPCVVGGVPIVQVGWGTERIGRADITIDTETGSVVGFHWESVPVDRQHCPEDEMMKEVLSAVKTDLDKKYLKVLGFLRRKLTHPVRYRETELGNLFADLLLKDTLFDLIMLGSGSIRKEESGPVITLQEFKELFPYDGQIWVVQVTGSQLRRMISYVYRDEALTPGSHAEFFQVSAGCRFVWSQKNHRFTEFSLNGTEIGDDRLLFIGMQIYHLRNFEHYFGFSPAELEKNMKPHLLWYSVCDILEETLENEGVMDAHLEGRILPVDTIYPI